jgi:hypothetical protein
LFLAISSWHVSRIRIIRRAFRRAHFSGWSTMLLTASSLVLSIALTAGAAEPADTRVAAPLPEATATISLNEAAASVTPADFGTSFNVPAWLTDAPTARPTALPAMYAALGALNVFDIYSTRRSVNRGGTELNPAMRGAAGNAGTMLAVKALSTAGSIFFTERAWKKNRKGAVIMMAVVNGVTAAVVANNMKAGR